MKHMMLAQYRATGRIAKVNLAGVTQEQDRVTPPVGGNCINWVLGHLTDTYNSFLPILGQEKVWQQEEGKPYARGSEPLAPGVGLAWDRLLADWQEAESRFLAGLEAFDPDRFADKAPFSPLDDPNETMGSLLGLLVFHQAYHVGQLGVLRRVAGLETGVK